MRNASRTDNINYRTEIDGLRALAVISVILFHAELEFFSGGFVGVDVFFVISGYLITIIIFEDIKNKRFGIINFYERRVRRIFPALCTLLIFSILYGFYTSPFYARDIFQSIFATTLFSENFLLLHEQSDYFALGTEDKFLFHTWSLAVEGQFYIIYPVLFIFALRFGKHKVFWMFILIAIISLLLSEWMRRNQASANFYLVFTRAWEFFAGSIAAFIVQRQGIKNNNLVAFLGLAAIIFSIFAFDESTPFPSVYSLVPVLGTMLILMYAKKETLTAKFLCIKVFVGVGLVSYSAYLWHQPLIIIFNKELSNFIIQENKLYYGVIIVCVTLILATVSYYLIERPFRYKTNKKTFLNLFSFLTVAILVISLFGHKTVGYRDYKIKKLAKYPSLYIDHFESRKLLSTKKNIKRESKMPNVLAIGDSMSLDFVRALSMKGLFVERFILNGLCFKKLIERESYCNTTLQQLKSKVTNFDYVFIANDYVKEKNFNDAINLYVALADTGNIYFINGFRFEHASDISYRFATGREQYSKQAIFNSLHNDVHVYNQKLQRYQNIKIVDKYSYFCNDHKHECLLYSDSGKPFRYDELHLTVDGLKYYGDKLVETFCQISNRFCLFR